MINLIFNSDCFKILTFFSLSPGSRWKRKEVQEKIKLNNVPLDKALSSLTYSGIIKKENNYYALNFENKDTKKIREICSQQYQKFRELPLEVYYLLIDFSEGITSLKGVEVYLFGSYAKLIYRENSDVDLAILYSQGIDKKLIAKIIVKLEKKYRKKIEAHYFEKKSFYRNKKDSLVKNILKDGIKII